MGAHRRELAGEPNACYHTLNPAIAVQEMTMQSRPSRLSRGLDLIERVGNRLPDPVLIFLWLILAVIVLSVIGALAGWEAVNPVSRQTVRTTSLLSSANLERLFVEMPRTLTGFAPLGYVLLVMLGAGIAERTGLAGAAMRSAVAKAPASWLTPLVIFVSVMANQAGDAAFVVMIPLAGALFAAAGRHPIVGIAASFAGVAGGFSANLLPGQLDALLLGITEPAAQLLVPGWKMNIAGNWYFIIGMTLIMVPLGWYITDRVVAPRFGAWTPTADTPIHEVGTELTAAERRGLRAAGMAGLVVVALFALLAWPGAWFAAAGDAPLFNEQAGAAGVYAQALQPLLQSMVAAFFLLFLVTGIAYGRAAGVNKNHRDEIRMISDGMASMSYYIVMAFVAAHFVALFNWSNLGLILAINGAEALGRLSLPPALLVGAIVLMSANINLLIGSASAKWGMLAPVLVPMLMLLGISPEMTTAAFRMGDSVTNPITPLLVYFPLVLVFCQRWIPRFGIGTLVAAMLPYSLAFLLSGLLMTMAWVAFELPVGPGAAVRFALPN
jgi:aminobenzoyl-glutamate transport protein